MTLYLAGQHFGGIFGLADRIAGLEDGRRDFVDARGNGFHRRRRSRPVMTSTTPSITTPQPPT